MDTPESRPFALLSAGKEMTDRPERTRLQRANVLDRTAVAALYDDYHLPVYRYVYRRVGDVEVARDVTADVFQRLLQGLARGHGPQANVRAWLYRTAHNLVIDYYRRQQHRDHLPLEREALAGPDDPARAAERAMAAGSVRLALRSLTPDQQHVLALKFLEGLSNEEVATIVGKPVGAVKSLQHRGLHALRRLLDAGEEESVL